MSQISAEKKLELIRVIRSEHAQNKQLLKNREELLYTEKPSQKSEISGVKVRTFIAVLLVGSVFCMETLKSPTFKEPLNNLYAKITKDGNLFDFVEELTYTLKDD